MRMLGVDYGRRKIGLALGDTGSGLSEPLDVLVVKSFSDAVKKVLEASTVSNVSKVVVGISEGKSADETRRFIGKLRKKIGVPVVEHDETLTTKEAQELSIRAGIRRNKRKRLEDAYAAALILQDYLDKINSDY